jgi:hypothetical protein
MKWLKGDGTNMTLRTALLAGCVLAVLFTNAVKAQTAPLSQPASTTAQGASAGPSFAAWDSFAEELRQLGPKILAKLPARLRNDPQVQQEAGRLLLEAVAAKTIEAIGSDGDHPVFLPSLNVTLNVFQPNADTTYRNAIIGPGGSYRLRGERGSLRVFKLGQFGRTPAKASAGISALAYNDFNDLHLDQAGRFDVILSPIRPQGYAGDWWKLEEGTAPSGRLRLGYRARPSHLHRAARQAGRTPAS